MENNKSRGSDDIHTELLKCGETKLICELHKIIVKDWRNEETLQDWNRSIICPLNRKGLQLECSNHWGISLLNVMYKVFSSILYSRLEPLINKEIDSYQCGFQKSRGTVDQIFSLSQVFRNFLEFGTDVHVF